MKHTQKKFEQLIWEKEFPGQPFDENKFYDWAADNTAKTFFLALKIGNEIIQCK